MGIICKMLTYNSLKSEVHMTDVAQLTMINEKLSELKGRVITTETIMETLVAQGVAQAEINNKQVEILQTLAAQQEINRSRGERLGKVEQDNSNLRKRVEEIRLEGKLTTLKVSFTVGIIITVATKMLSTWMPA